ncbi:hypothetical protein NECID01_0488 [Nematocida sp. AWRm77]|nr:hypothetical protein NECID01_0488 [Nematocida sp. AWRm77]
MRTHIRSLNKNKEILQKLEQERDNSLTLSSLLDTFLIPAVVNKKVLRMIKKFLRNKNSIERERISKEYLCKYLHLVAETACTTIYQDMSSEEKEIRLRHLFETVDDLYDDVSEALQDTHLSDEDRCVLIADSIKRKITDALERRLTSNEKREVQSLQRLGALARTESKKHAVSTTKADDECLKNFGILYRLELALENPDSELGPTKRKLLKSIKALKKTTEQTYYKLVDDMSHLKTVLMDDLSELLKPLSFLKDTVKSVQPHFSDIQHNYKQYVSDLKNMFEQDFNDNFAINKNGVKYEYSMKNMFGKDFNDNSMNNKNGANYEYKYEYVYNDEPTVTEKDILYGIRNNMFTRSRFSYLCISLCTSILPFLFGIYSMASTHMEKTVNLSSTLLHSGIGSEIVPFFICICLFWHSSLAYPLPKKYSQGAFKRNSYALLSLAFLEGLLIRYIPFIVSALNINQEKHATVLSSKEASAEYIKDIQTMLAVVLSVKLIFFFIHHILMAFEHNGLRSLMKNKKTFRNILYKSFVSALLMLVAYILLSDYYNGQLFSKTVSSVLMKEPSKIYLSLFA